MKLLIKSNWFLSSVLYDTTKICSLRLEDKNIQVSGNLKLKPCHPVHQGTLRVNDGPIPLSHALRLLKSMEATYYLKSNSDGRLAEKDHIFSRIKIQVRGNWLNNKVKWSLYIMA